MNMEKIKSAIGVVSSVVEAVDSLKVVALSSRLDTEFKVGEFPTVFRFRVFKDGEIADEYLRLAFAFNAAEHGDLMVVATKASTTKASKDDNGNFIKNSNGDIVLSDGILKIRDFVTIVTPGIKIFAERQDSKGFVKRYRFRLERDDRSFSCQKLEIVFDAGCSGVLTMNMEFSPKSGCL